ncbi:transcriptional repressor LexA [Pseudolysobacter antarcticus]|uniref:LexA repressor n=1 Tax=Pseudolysobacter antarcticus TaxID=2511995 RepID=A0A411HI22_9GAMM|nr:transcriptional repressor LexA [Pseudolysobacter antarcticus]QBB70166.1 transcriptional repressor LexA [Pseudolysobacter antarcticus]
MKILTARQQSILDFVRECISAHRLPPTQAEIAEAFGFTQRAAEDHVRAIAAKGFLVLQPGKARGIGLSGQAANASPFLELPLVGRVAAGQPILSEGHIERQFSIDRHMFRPRPHYLLRVEGESMRDVGIMHRDLIAVHRSPDATNGQIVVARIDGEITVKRFRQVRQRILLLPENPDFAPIEVDPRTDDFAIEGLYVGSIRIPS